jgi:hypothetical protein
LSRPDGVRIAEESDETNPEIDLMVKKNPARLLGLET